MFQNRKHTNSSIVVCYYNGKKMEFPSPVCFRSKTVQSYCSSWYKVEGLLFNVESQNILLYFDRVMILTFTMVELCLHCMSRVRPWRTIDGPLLGLFVTCSGLKYEQRARSMKRNKLLVCARCAKKISKWFNQEHVFPFSKHAVHWLKIILIEMIMLFCSCSGW